jgi:hypothetical protein
MLERAGVSLKQAMQLARHSDPRLTMKRYGKTTLDELGQAVGGLFGGVFGPGGASGGVAVRSSEQLHSSERQRAG